MKDDLPMLTHEYTSALQEYLLRKSKADGVLQQAPDLGRQAIGKGLGMHDLVNIHQEALLRIPPEARGSEEGEQVDRSSAEFLLKSLLPFVKTGLDFVDIGTSQAWPCQEGILTPWERLDVPQGNEDLSREALRKSEERFRVLFEGAAIGLALVDMEGHPVESNPALQAMLGYSKRELVGMVFTEFTHPDDVSACLDLFQELIAGKRDSYQMEKRYIRKDGRVVWGRLTVSLVRRARSEPLFAIGMVEDITERKRLEEQLGQSQKMEAIGRLAGGVAHDFSNLLTIIHGYAGLMLNRLPEEDPVRQQAVEIQRASERAASLTRQLLAFSRKHVLQPRVLDLNGVVDNMQKMLCRLIGEDIDLVMVLDPALERVKADPGQIEQVIMNLAVNARDAMPKGGKLTIETQNVTLDQTYARQHLGVLPGRYAMMAVSDSGCGMDEETRSRIFDPFFTTKEQGMGTGLGLSTVYGIVRQSGGFIWVYSEPGAGATFKIYLPTVSEPAEAVETVGNRSPRGSETVLLVEDEVAVRELVTEMLQVYGYSVLEAHSTDEAIQICERFEGPIQMMVTDVVMPRMSGGELAQQLIPLRPKMKVLYMSGYTDDTVVRHGVLAPGSRFLEKPFTLDSLVTKVREVLDESRDQ